MDILRKMFKSKEKEIEEQNNDAGKDEFRKPQWFEESETDDELFDDDRKFAFQIYTNPMELQKHFERQMQQFLEAMNEYEGTEVTIEKNLKEEFLKPGFESKLLKEFEKQRNGYIDTDLDGEIHADELHSLIQSLKPNADLPNILPRNDLKKNRKQQSKKKFTDEETILGKIHGTIVDEETRKQSVPRAHADIMTPMLPRSSTPPFGGGIFEDTYQGPKMFSQSVMSKTIRKPDGTYETTKITQDSNGKKTTTVTRTIDGRTETTTTYDSVAGSSTIKQRDDKDEPEMHVYSDRNIFVTPQGYALPRNLW